MSLRLFMSLYSSLNRVEAWGAGLETSGQGAVVRCGNRVVERAWDIFKLDIILSLILFIYISLYLNI